MARKFVWIDPKINRFFYVLKKWYLDVAQAPWSSTRISHKKKINFSKFRSKSAILDKSIWNQHLFAQLATEHE